MIHGVRRTAHVKTHVEQITFVAGKRSHAWNDHKKVSIDQIMLPIRIALTGGTAS